MKLFVDGHGNAVGGSAVAVEFDQAIPLIAEREFSYAENPIWADDTRESAGDGMTGVWAFPPTRPEVSFLMSTRRR